MQRSKRYPNLNIRSKNELAKHISGRSFSTQKALNLINDVIENFDHYWSDSKSSEPEEQKWVRSAAGTPLSVLLDRIDNKVLRPHDKMLPGFIFGGISGRNHIQAAHSLLGRRKKRMLLGLDITRFFEQISKRRVYEFFRYKCLCTKRIALLLAIFCCVPEGKKGSGQKNEMLARGFSTSPRLAVWTNLDTFLRLKWKTGHLLKGYDPKVAIFVDDIGISASRLDVNKMEQFESSVKNLLLNFDKNQKLPVNKEKTKKQAFSDGVEHLGLHLGRNKVTMGNKTRLKRKQVARQLTKTSGQEKRLLKKQNRSYYQYQKQIERINNQ